MMTPSDKVPVDRLRTSRQSAVVKPGGYVCTDVQIDARLQSAIDNFLLSRRVGNCTERTLGWYRDIFHDFACSGATLDCDTLHVQHYLTGLRDRMQAISVHKRFRALWTFFSWAVAAQLRPNHPMQGMSMKKPHLLPRVPEDQHVRRLLAACSTNFEGRRNKALVALLADSGLRISEALRLRVEDVRFGERTIAVRQGKGGKDGVGFMGVETARVLREWLQVRPGIEPEDFLFVSRHGTPLDRSYACEVLHKLSVRAGLPRKIGPHALRHYAATSILKQTGDLELVRQVLRHNSLTMALVYARLTQTDVSRKFRRASPLDNLRTGR